MNQGYGGETPNKRGFMFLADGWSDFRVLDAGNGMKLERWKDITLLRPDPQAVWPMAESAADAVYLRSETGGGHWEFSKQLPEQWKIQYRDLTFLVRPTGFKHTGLFPEQAVNWDWMRGELEQWKQHHDRAPRVLNLFAYTGGASVACAAAGAEVVHVDAAKGMVAWAKNNAEASGLNNAGSVIVDDCVKCSENCGRGNTTTASNDPPRYSSGPTARLEDRKRPYRGGGLCGAAQRYPRVLFDQLVHYRTCRERAQKRASRGAAGWKRGGGRGRPADRAGQSGAALRFQRALDAGQTKRIKGE